MTIVRDLVESFLNSMEILGLNYLQELDSLMEELLQHKHIIPPNRITAALATVSWHYNHTYFCFLLRPKTASVQDKDLITLSGALSGSIPESGHILYSHEIFFVVNLSRNTMSREQILSLITPFLRDNLLLISSGPEFQDFKLLYYFYRLAQQSMAIGMKSDPTFWHFHVENYLLDILIQKCKYHTLPEAFIPNGLNSLIVYDRQHGTDYTGLLKIYLECERSIVRTIKQAYLHRNTFLYRLDRIKEISGLDLDDPKMRLTLMICFKMLE